MNENRAIRESGALRFIRYAVVVLVIAAIAYVFRAVTFDAHIAPVGLAIAIAILAASEVRFQEVRNELKDIKQTLEEIKNKKWPPSPEMEHSKRSPDYEAEPESERRIFMINSRLC